MSPPPTMAERNSSQRVAPMTVIATNGRLK
jgi:hypothetical protein